MSEKSIALMTDKEKKYHSLSTRVFRLVLLGASIMGILLLLLGIFLYSLAVANQYISTSYTLAHSAAEVLQKSEDVEALANEVTGRFRSMTDAERAKLWRDARGGEIDIMIGPRSALFTPFQDPGLIILDEEHETTYKSEQSPRYHAAEVAEKMGQLWKIPVVLGSATPRVETFYKAEQGIYAYLPLKHRAVPGALLPEMKIIDMREEMAAGNLSIFCSELMQAIRTRLEKGEQTILFLNRKGYSTFVNCRSCGFVLKCPRCNLPYTWHKDRGLLICHYCGYSQRPERACPNCGSLQVGYNGFGTEKIEEDIKRLFPSLKTLRLDSDTASDKGRTKEVLDSFAKGEADILLGTQMVAKGFNFPKVSLVGIILADTTLQMPDFRSAERTFSLLTQVSGRAGRFSAGGKVIIQTYRPGNYAIACAAALDEKSFYRSELQSRQLLGFPPFSRLFRFVFRSKNQEKALSSASDFAQMLTRMQPTGFRFQMLGPAECPLAVISDNYRYQIIINTDKFASAHGVLSAALASYKVPSGVYVEADVDPLSLM